MQVRNQNKKRTPEFTRWILDENNNPIQVNVWQNKQYRHGSDWDITNHIETVEGVKVKAGKWECSEVIGYETKEDATASIVPKSTHYFHAPDDDKGSRFCICGKYLTDEVHKRS